GLRPARRPPRPQGLEVPGPDRRRLLQAPPLRRSPRELREGPRPGPPRRGRQEPPRTGAREARQVTRPRGRGRTQNLPPTPKLAAVAPPVSPGRGVPALPK